MIRRGCRDVFELRGWLGHTSLEVVKRRPVGCGGGASAGVAGGDDPNETVYHHFVQDRLRWYNVYELSLGVNEF